MPTFPEAARMLKPAFFLAATNTAPSGDLIVFGTPPTRRIADRARG